MKNHTIFIKKPIVSPFGQPMMMAKIPIPPGGEFHFLFVPRTAAEWGIYMAYEEKQLPHHVVLEGRGSLSVSGVEEVESFDEETIVMLTVKGTLVVRGEGLHIEKLSLDGGDLKVEGAVDSLTYEDEGREKGGFLARLLR